MSAGGRYRYVFENEWRDPRLRRLGAAARVVRFYVTAGPQTTSVGCFRLSTAVAVEDLGGSAEEFERDLAQVCETFGWSWDPLARVVWLADWFERDAPKSPNVVRSWPKLLQNVPDCDVRAEAIASIDASLLDLPESFRKPWRELSKSFRRSKSQSKSDSKTNHGSQNLSTRNTEQEGRSEQKTELHVVAPSNPKLDEIAQRAADLTNSDDDDVIFDHFVSLARIDEFTEYRRDQAIGAVRRERAGARRSA